MAIVGTGLLAEKKEKVLAAWEARSLKEIPSACHSGSLALRDSLPSYLEHLSDALNSNRKMDRESVYAHDREGGRIGRLHGKDRADNTSYTLTEVISEYHILREVIFETLESEKQLTALNRDIVLDSIEQAVNDAAVKFSEVHHDIRRKFIDTLTHDLKNPIAAAKMNAELILREATKLGTGPVTEATRILRNLDRVTAMIHDLLDAGRIRAGEELNLQFTECDLREIVHGIVEEMKIVHGDLFILDAKEPIRGFWGSDGFHRAVENLIGNAVKYGDEKRSIRIALSKTDKVVELRVHNDGPIISGKELPLLFEQYRRAKSAEESEKAGWGLGLTVVKGVADAHGGKVTVESTKEKGTTFTLELPFTEAPAPRTAKTQAPETRAQSLTLKTRSPVINGDANPPNRLLPRSD